MLARKDSISELVLKVKYLVEYMVGIHSKYFKFFLFKFFPMKKPLLTHTLMIHWTRILMMI